MIPFSAVNYHHAILNVPAFPGCRTPVREHRAHQRLPLCLYTDSALIPRSSCAERRINTASRLPAAAAVLPFSLHPVTAPAGTFLPAQAKHLPPYPLVRDLPGPAAVTRIGYHLPRCLLDSCSSVIVRSAAYAVVRLAWFWLPSACQLTPERLSYELFRIYEPAVTHLPCTSAGKPAVLLPVVPYLPRVTWDLLPHQRCLGRTPCLPRAAR